MTAGDRSEYSELRATIRERGTARLWLFVVGVGSGIIAGLGSSLQDTAVMGSLVRLGHALGLGVVATVFMLGIRFGQHSALSLNPTSIVVGAAWVSIGTRLRQSVAAIACCETSSRSTLLVVLARGPTNTGERG